MADFIGTAGQGIGTSRKQSIRLPSLDLVRGKELDSEELPPSPPRSRQDQDNLTVRLKGIERNMPRLWSILVAMGIGKIKGETAIHSVVRS